MATGTHLGTGTGLILVFGQHVLSLAIDASVVAGRLTTRCQRRFGIILVTLPDRVKELLIELEIEWYLNSQLAREMRTRGFGLQRRANTPALFAIAPTEHICMSRRRRVHARASQ